MAHAFADCLVSVPLQVAFFHEYQIMHPGVMGVWSSVDTVIDVFFIVDILINCACPQTGETAVSRTALNRCCIRTAAC